MMVEKNPYTAFPNEESPRYDEPFLDDIVLFHRENRIKLQRQLHWAVHCLCFIAIVGLSFEICFANQSDQAKCWDMFNYYCTTAICSTH